MIFRALKVNVNIVLLPPLLALRLALPMEAQVEKAAMRTTGISCGSCAVFSEVYLRRLPEIEKIKISLSREAVMVTYKAGASFRPKELRDALKKTEVGITQLQISARGRVQEYNGKQIFVAGQDKFLLAVPRQAGQIPLNTPVLIEGIVNDQTRPMELKVMTFVPGPQHQRD